MTEASRNPANLVKPSGNPAAPLCLQWHYYPQNKTKPEESIVTADPRNSCMRIVNKKLGLGGTITEMSAKVFMFERFFQQTVVSRPRIQIPYAGAGSVILAQHETFRKKVYEQLCKSSRG